MECTLVTIPISREIYIEGIPEVLKYIDNKSAYIANHTTYVKLSDYLNGLYEREVVEACYYTEDTDIEIFLLDERMTISQLQAIGNQIDHQLIESIGIKEYDPCSSCMNKLLSVVYRKLF